MNFARKLDRAFWDGFWDGVCAPMFLFTTPRSNLGPLPPALSVGSNLDKLLDLLLGKREVKQLPNTSSSSKQSVAPSRTAETHMSPRWEKIISAPQSLSQLEQIVPGAAERILRLVEQEQESIIKRRTLAIEHRSQVIEQRSADLVSTAKHTSRGQWMGFLLVLIAIATGALTSLIGAPWQLSIAFVSLPVLGVVRAFVVDRRRDSRSEHH